MTQLTFFHQKRVDRGTRTGIDVNGDTHWHHYEKGSEIEDSGLRWFVDVRCRGDDLPTESVNAQMWFRESPQMQRIKKALENLAVDFQAGFDNDTWPSERGIPTDAEEPEMKIVFSAMRRVDARDMAQVFLELSNGWAALIANLQQPVAV